MALREEFDPSALGLRRSSCSSELERIPHAWAPQGGTLGVWAPLRVSSAFLEAGSEQGIRTCGHGCWTCQAWRRAPCGWDRRAPPGLPPAEVEARPPGFRAGPAGLLPRVPRRNHPEALAQHPPAPQRAFSQEFRLCSVSCSSAQGLTLRACLSLGQRGWGHTAHGSTQPSWAPRTPHGRRGVLVQSSQWLSPGAAAHVGVALGDLVGGAAQMLSGACLPCLCWSLESFLHVVASGAHGHHLPPHISRASFLWVGRLLPAPWPVPALRALSAPP